MREALELARKALAECGEKLESNELNVAPVYDEALAAIDAALAQAVSDANVFDTLLSWLDERTRQR